MNGQMAEKMMCTLEQINVGLNWVRADIYAVTELIRANSVRTRRTEFEAVVARLVQRGTITLADVERMGADRVEEGVYCGHEVAAMGSVKGDGALAAPETGGAE